jgi:hypothetical protein
MKKIVLILCVIVFAAFLASCNAQQPNQSVSASPAGPAAAAQSQTASASPSPAATVQTSDGTNLEVTQASNGVVVSADEEPLQTLELDKVFTDTESYVGKNISIEGKVYGTPETNQDMLMFNATYNGDDSKSMVVSFLNDVDQIELSSGDSVKITGVVVSAYKSKAPDGKDATMPMITAMTLEKAESSQPEDESTGDEKDTE